MIPLRSLALLLVLLAAPVVAMPDPPQAGQPAVVTRPVARPFDLTLDAIAATLACLDNQTGRRRC